MQVRVVDMPVDQPAMPVGVAMRLRADSMRMVVLVVLVVNMRVVVLRRQRGELHDAGELAFVSLLS